MKKLNIGISDHNRGGVVHILNSLLADEYVLYTKTRNYHWHVTGFHFSELHKFFESQYEELEKTIDEVAERARSLGGKSLGTLKEFLQHTCLKETPGKHPAAERMVGDLLNDHEAIIRSLREDLMACDEKYGDTGTNDFLTGLMEQHEKMAWMLRAHLE
jgi:starvation-inducible DNA-binding protein